jgi:hypothetical protein
MLAVITGMVSGTVPRWSPAECSSPGDDAADARWVDAIELASLPITEGLTETLTSWVFWTQKGIYRPI